MPAATGPCEAVPVAHQPLRLSRSTGPIANTQLIPYNTTLTMLARRLSVHPAVGPRDGPYLVRGPADTANARRNDDNIVLADVVILDGDKRFNPASEEAIDGAPPLKQVHDVLRSLGVAHVITSTRSHDPANGFHRFRCIIPCRHENRSQLQAAVAYLIHLLHEAGCWLADVPENTRWSQGWYLPCVRDDAAPFDCFTFLEGQALDLEAALTWQQAQSSTSSVDRSSLSSVPPRPSDPASPIAAFLAEHNSASFFTTLLDARGYRSDGKRAGTLNGQPTYRYLSPHSTTGNAGISVFCTEDGNWRLKSFHNANEPLSRDGNEVTICDAWDVYRILEHDGDTRAALAAYRPQSPINTKTAVGTSSGPQVLDNIEAAQPLDPASFPNQRLTSNGKIVLPGTVANVRHLVDSYGITTRYDVIGKRTDVLIPGLQGCPENADNSSLNHVMSLATLNGIANGQVPDYVQTIADRNQYNPVRAYVDRFAWDGQDRINPLLATLTLKDDFPSALALTLLTRWLISAVAAACKPQGFRSRGVLVLQGPQSIGKTAWISALVDDPALRTTLIKVDHHLDAADKDSRITAISHWIVEIGELDSSFRKDVARLKGFLTANMDKVRRPYGRLDSEYPRRTVFCASVNSEQFLVDDTGNTRWWTLPVTAIDYRHGIDMQQLWAQVHTLYEQGEQWWLTPQEEQQLEDHNAGHRSVSAIRDLLERAIDVSRVGQGERMNATHVLYCIGIKNPTNTQARECGVVLRELLGEPTRSKGQTRWQVPFRDCVKEIDH